MMKRDMGYKKYTINYLINRICVTALSNENMSQI